MEDVVKEYTIRRIGLGSALRIGLALGWLVALIPSLVVSALVVAALRQVSAALGKITPYELSLLGQTVARFDLIQALGLSGLVGTLARLSGAGVSTFLILAALLTLAGALMIVLVILLFCLFYNLLAAAVGGLKVELSAT